MKKRGMILRSSLTAESQGFEPRDLLQSTVFKTAAIDRSANSPCRESITGIDAKKICFAFFYSFFSLRSLPMAGLYRLRIAVIDSIP